MLGEFGRQYYLRVSDIMVVLLAAAAEVVEVIAEAGVDGAEQGRDVAGGLQNPVKLNVGLFVQRHATAFNLELVGNPDSGVLLGTGYRVGDPVDVAHHRLVEEDVGECQDFVEDVVDEEVLVGAGTLATTVSLFLSVFDLNFLDPSLQK